LLSERRPRRRRDRSNDRSDHGGDTETVALVFLVIARDKATKQFSHNLLAMSVQGQTGLPRQFFELPRNDTLEENRAKDQEAQFADRK
jgi:hypothetical protein